nr:nucleotidyltransferase domain-containing protein [Ornithinimicrobium sp. F0845]
MILRVQVGSGVHGTSISGQDDRDEMGICLEPAEFVTGLARVPRGIESDSQIDFEQFQRHTDPAAGRRSEPLPSGAKSRGVCRSRGEAECRSGARD